MPFQAVLGCMKAFVVDPFGPMSKCVGLRRFDKLLRLSFAVATSAGVMRLSVLHSFHAIVDPGLKTADRRGQSLEVR